MKSVMSYLLAVLCFGPAMAFADSGVVEEVDLNFSCGIARLYADAKGNGVWETLTPKTGASKLMKISKVKNGSLPQTVVEYTVNTPDGPVTVSGTAVGSDMFNVNYSTSIITRLTFVAYKLSSTGTPNMEVSDYKKMGKIMDESLQISTGLKADGFSTNSYYLGCKIERVK